jgi:putative FmdB family regulatory protein
MPIFEYNCDHCSYTFDKLVISRDAEVNCPLCQGDVKKLMSVFSVRAQDNLAAKFPADTGRKMCTSC